MKIKYKLWGVTFTSRKDDDCVVGACPYICERFDKYLIIGKQIDPKKVGLEKRVGEGEVLIEVPRELIDNKTVNQEGLFFF